MESLDINSSIVRGRPTVTDANPGVKSAAAPDQCLTVPLVLPCLDKEYLVDLVEEKEEKNKKSKTDRKKHTKEVSGSGGSGSGDKKNVTGSGRSKNSRTRSGPVEAMASNSSRDSGNGKKIKMYDDNAKRHEHGFESDSSILSSSSSKTKKNSWENQKEIEEATASILRQLTHDSASESEPENHANSSSVLPASIPQQNFYFSEPPAQETFNEQTNSYYTAATYTTQESCSNEQNIKYSHTPLPEQNYHDSAEPLAEQNIQYSAAPLIEQPFYSGQISHSVGMNANRPAPPALNSAAPLILISGAVALNSDARKLANHLAETLARSLANMNMYNYESGVLLVDRYWAEEMVRSCCGSDQPASNALSRIYAVSRRISAECGRESMSGVQYTVAGEFDEIIGWIESNSSLVMSVQSILEQFNKKFSYDLVTNIAKNNLSGKSMFEMAMTARWSIISLNKNDETLRRIANVYFGSPLVCVEAFEKKNRMESCFVWLYNTIADGQKNREQTMIDYDQFIRANITIRLGFLRDVVEYTLNLARCVDNLTRQL